jgi:hypothetical protein
MFKWLRLAWQSFVAGYQEGRRRRRLVVAIRNYRDALPERREFRR